MIIKIINPIDYPNWNEQVAELPGATIFHTANWARVLMVTYNYTPRYFCSFSNKRLAGLIPMMEVNSFVTGKRGVSLPFSDRVDPLVPDQPTFEDMFERLKKYAGENHWQSIGFHGGDGRFHPDQAYTSYVNSFIELDGSARDLFAGFKSSTRRNVRKAQRSGVTARIGTTPDDIEAFYRLNCLSRKDHGLPPQPLSFFKRIQTDVIARGQGFVCLALYGGESVAGVVFFHFGKHAIYKYGASEKRFLHLRPNNISMWQAIEACVRERFSMLDLGRSDEHHYGLLRFKRSWNASEKPIHYYRYDVRQQRFRTQTPGLRSSYNLFKYLPLPLLKVIGRVVYRHVG